MSLMCSETLKPVLSCGLESLPIGHIDSSAQDHGLSSGLRVLLEQEKEDALSRVLYRLGRGHRPGRAHANWAERNGAGRCGSERGDHTWVLGAL